MKCQTTRCGGEACKRRQIERNSRIQATGQRMIWLTCTEIFIQFDKKVRKLLFPAFSCAFYTPLAALFTHKSIR